MYYVFLLLLYYTANVFGKDFLDGKRERIHNVLSEVNLDVALVEPVMADELALAVADFDAGKAVCFCAFELLDVVLVVVPDVFAKSRLLVKAGLLPLGAVCVAGIVGALVPCFEDGHSVLVVLHNHEARVDVGAVEAIRVVLRLLCGPGVLCHDKRMVWLDVPVVEQPLNGHVEEAECGVCVEEDNKLVVFDVVCERRRLDPGRVAVFEFACVDELVVVTVDEGVRVVIEDTAGNVVDFSPVVLALAVRLGRGERPCFQIQNQDVAAHGLFVARVRRQCDVAAIWLADKRLRGRRLEILVQQADHITDGHIGLRIGCGPVATSVSWGRGERAETGRAFVPCVSRR